MSRPLWRLQGRAPLPLAPLTLTTALPLPAPLTRLRPPADGSRRPEITTYVEAAGRHAAIRKIANTLAALKGDLLMVGSTGRG